MKKEKKKQQQKKKTVLSLFLYFTRIFKFYFGTGRSDLQGSNSFISSVLSLFLFFSPPVLLTRSSHFRTNRIALELR